MKKDVIKLQGKFFSKKCLISSLPRQYFSTHIFTSMNKSQYRPKNALKNLSAVLKPKYGRSPGVADRGGEFRLLEL